MAMEKTTDWSKEKEAAAKNLPVSEKVNPALHKTKEGKDRSADETKEVPAVPRSSAKDEKAGDQKDDQS